MPAPAPFSPSHGHLPYPALYLYPLNGTFVPKHISLANNQRVKIGRQTNAKTAPDERNGYFDSKVLSRQHAEVWEEDNKIFIKDVKSSNGTFINGERLSQESLESEPFELKTDDIVEFGIDIVGEDNKTIIHHKVAARVLCVLNEQDALVAAHAEQHQQQHQQMYQAGQPSSSLVPSSGPGPVNGAPSAHFNFGPGQQRRPQLAQQGLSGMGGMGGSMRPPGKSGLSFDHILSRLQGELQKSRETGAELHSLTDAMNEIHDTLGGSLPANVPPYPPTLPPVRLPQSQQQSNAASASGSPEQQSAAPSAAATASALVDLQKQLQDTQSSLSTHIDKIRALEGALAEQETIRQEVKSLKEIVESSRKDAEHRTKRYNSVITIDEPRGGFDLEDEGDHGLMDDDDDDDARSVSTVVPHELERVDEVDEEQVAAKEHDEAHTDTDSQASQTPNVPEDVDNEDELVEDEEKRRRRNEQLGRPRTPEPHLGLRATDAYGPTAHSDAPATGSSSSSVNDEALEQVLVQVKALMALTTSLEAQHSAAQSTITALESKVQALEETVKATKLALAEAQAASPPAPPPPPVAPAVSEERESLTAMIMEWKKAVEGQWSSVQEEWSKERERLNQAREEWEGKVHQMDSGLEKLATLQSTTAALQQQQQQLFQSTSSSPSSSHQNGLPNGDASKHTGLVTPPSPRSLSSDSDRSRRRRTRSGSSRRGRVNRRSRSRNRSREGDGEGVELDTDTDTTLASDASGSPSKKASLTSLPSYPLDDGKLVEDDEEEDTVLGVRPRSPPNGALATPDSSIYKLSAAAEAASGPVASKFAASSRTDATIHLQTAIGVLVLSVAAAAVIWRVKPET